MLGWQWHQVDHMQTIGTSLQTDNHTSTSSLNFYTLDALSVGPTNSVEALKEVSSREFQVNQKKIPPTTFVDITAMHGNFCTKFYTIVKRSNIHFITKFY